MIIFDRNELAGAVADIGVFVPIVAALVIFNGVNVTMALSLAGLLYILSGLYFKIPVPVQPLKAIAAIAIASGVGSSVLSAAGIWMGAILLFLVVSGFINSLEKVLSRPVIRGIQLSLGITLVKTGYELLTKKQFLINGPIKTLTFLSYQMPVGLVVGILGLLLILLLKSNRRLPASLMVIGFGLLSGIAFGGFSKLLSLDVGPANWQFDLPRGIDFIPALTLLVIPQIPMTLANSIIATSSTGKRYFQEKAERLTPKALAISLGITNLVSGFLGGMPLCHGAGGMTAHYKFGARSGGANLIIGGVMIIVALFFGKSALTIMSIIPFSIYGILLIYLGIEHAVLIADSLEDKQHLFVAVAIGALSVASGNLFIAVISGISLNFILSLISSPRFESLKIAMAGSISQARK